MARLPTVVVGLALAAAPLRGQDEALQTKINRAIDQGVKLLKQQQAAEGHWDGAERAGLTALCGWTLLEAGVAATDSSVQKAVALVRQECLSLQSTYTAAVTIFFLDKLGDPTDVPLIEALAIQLLTVHNQFNGWDYHCAPLDRAARETIQARVKAVREARSPEDKKTDGAGKKATKPKAPPEVLKLLARLHSDPDIRSLNSGAGDNSNTQFAMMALWVARRHGMPVDDALLKVENRFRQSQQDAGTWGYKLDPCNLRNADPSAEYAGTPTFTAAGLLAYALGHGVKKDSKTKDLLKDAGVKAGMAALSKYLDKLSEDKDKFFQNGKNYCFLWSLERMAVVYNLKKVGERDWYPWGAELLVDQLDKAGAWTGSYGTADTCFAILFLKRANVAEDLTRQLNLFNPIIKVPPPKR